MKRTASCVFTAILCSLALLLPTGLGRACFSLWPESYRIALYRETLVLDPALRIFSYGRWDLARRDFYRPDSDELYLGAEVPLDQDQSANLHEWAEAVGLSCPMADIRAVVYEKDSEQLLQSLQGNRLLRRYPNNRFAAALCQKKHRALRDYLVLAKTIEAYVAWAEDPWDAAFGGGPAQEGESQRQWLEKAIKGLKSAQTKFLQDRYAFQAVRLYFFSREFEACLKLFREHFLPNRYRHFTGAWAAHLASGAAIQLRDRPMANYCAALAFETAINRREAAIRQFAADPSLLEPTLALAQNQPERLAVRAMYALQEPWRSLGSIRFFLESAPDSRFLPLLLAREVNKIEDWLLTPMVGHINPSMDRSYDYDFLPDGFPDLSDPEWASPYYSLQRFRHDQRYLSEFRELLEKKSGPVLETPNGPYLALATAHLYLLEKNAEKARQWLKKISAHENEDVRFQLLLEEILCDAAGPLQDPKVRSHLAVSLSRLEAQLETYPQGRTTFLDLLSYLGEQFKRSGDKPLAYLFESRKNSIDNPFWAEEEYPQLEWLNRYGSPEEVGMVIDFFEKKKGENPPLVDYLMPREPKTSQLRELQGTLYFRQHEYHKALEAWGPLPDDYWETANNGKFALYLRYDPFSVFWDARSSHFPRGGKKEVARRMLQLIKHISGEHGDRHKSYLALGHAYFNTGYYGHSWMVSAYGKSIGEACRENSRFSFGDFYPNCQKTGADYYSLDRARGAFEQAYRTCPPADRETMAEAAYMLHYLDYLEKHGSDQTLYYGNDRPQVYEHATPWLDLYLIKGRQTQFDQRLSKCLAR
jgi:hypothetical protein